MVTRDGRHCNRRMLRQDSVNSLVATIALIKKITGNDEVPYSLALDRSKQVSKIPETVFVVRCQMQVRRDRVFHAVHLVVVRKQS